MNYSGDAAEQVVRLSLETAEVAAKITGEGAKQIAILLYALLRDQEKTRGKTRLTSMLRSGKELKVSILKNTDFQLFYWGRSFSLRLFSSNHFPQLALPSTMALSFTMTNKICIMLKE